MEAINIDTEEWRVVPDFPDYEASTHGRVRRLTGSTGTHAGKLLNSYPAGHRFYVSLLNGERKKSYPLNSLVAHTWIGECPAGCIPGHIDGDTSNNRLDNIAYMTPAEARERIGRYRATYLPVLRTYESGRHLTRKLTDEQRAHVDMLAQLLADGQAHTAIEIVDVLGIAIPKKQSVAYVIGNLLDTAESAGLICYEDQGQIGLTEDRRAQYAELANKPTPIRAPLVEIEEVTQKEQEEIMPVEPITQELPAVEPVEQPAPDPEPEPMKSPLEGWTAFGYKRMVAGGLLSLEIYKGELDAEWNVSVAAANDALDATAPTPEDAAKIANQLAREWLMRAASELA